MEVAMADSNVSGFQQVAAENSEFNDNNSPAPHIDQDVAKPTQGQDVEKTLLEAEQFLTNFAGLREENENLKQQLQEIEVQLESVTQELRQCQLDKQSLEQVIVQEREHHKETLWSVRGELQKAQEERLSWKEKYLDACMESGSTPNNNITAPLGSQGSLSPGKRLSLLRPAKRKHEGEGSSSTATDGDQDYYANLETAFSLAEQDEQQPDNQIIVTLVDSATDEKPCKIAVHQCKICGVGFCSNFALYEHLKKCRRAHDQAVALAGPFTCEACDFQFKSLSDLRQHEQVHLGTHKLMCSECGRAYVSKSGLHKHQSLEHGDVVILRCGVCEKEFKRKDRLRDHIATMHSDAEPHECPFCDARYKLRDYLRKHVKEVHPEQSLKNLPKPAMEHMYDIKAVTQVQHLQQKLQEHMNDQQYEQIHDHIHEQMQEQLHQEQLHQEQLHQQEHLRQQEQQMHQQEQIEEEMRDEIQEHEMEEHELIEETQVITAEITTEVTTSQ